MKLQRTFCRVCEAHCGLVSSRDDSGKVVRLVPDREHPISQGFACAKGTRFLEVADDAQRLLRPLRRIEGGGFEQISWTDALGLFGQRTSAILRDHGPHAIALYLGTPAIHNALGAMAYFAFARSLGTRNLYSAGSQDNNNKIVAARLTHGSEWIHPIMDLDHADFALLLGTNPAVSRGTYAQWEAGTAVFDRFVARGGSLVWIDPMRSASAERWGQHVPIRPGSDIFLLLALMHELADLRSEQPRINGLERWLALASEYPAETAARLTGIPVDRIRSLGAAVRAAKRATFFLSVGVSQGRFGTICAIALQALAALTGHLDRTGGLLFQPWANLLAPLMRFTPQRSRIGGFMANAGGLPAGILADEILMPGAERIRALIVFAGNPLTSAADETRLRAAFRNLELLVSIDMFQNETGHESHLVLPATSWLERFDIGAWEAQFSTAGMLAVSPPVRQPPGEARPEWRIFADLSRAAGRPLLGPLTGLLTRLNIDRALGRCLAIALWPLRRAATGSYGLPWKRPRGGAYLRGRRRIRLWRDELNGEPARVAAWAAEMDGRMPEQDVLVLIGRRRRLGHNSWLHGASLRGNAEAAAWLCSEDMQRLGLEDGDLVELSSEAGKLTLPVRARPGVMGGVIVVPHGLPNANVNRLIADGVSSIEPLSGMHQLSGHRVRIRKGIGAM